MSGKKYTTEDLKHELPIIHSFKIQIQNKLKIVLTRLTIMQKRPSTIQHFKQLGCTEHSIKKT